MQSVPKIVFIVPYRNRPQHKFFFSKYLPSIMPEDNYEIYFSHQCDVRSFNRGAVKNIGFIAVKEKYPEDYRDITFVFNDIDTIPFNYLFDYETVHGVVKHFYGFKYALGGIVSIKGSDFEATNGYPNFWGWGMEDNVLQKRCERIGLHIDRSHFYQIGSPNILQLFDGVTRLINRKDPWRATHDDGMDGIRTIHQLSYKIDTESDNPVDNVNVVDDERIFYINISTFMTGVRFEHDNYYEYDLREPPRKIIHPDKIKTRKLSTTTNDWSNIPFYPTAEKKKEMIQQYGAENAKKIIEYSYDNSVDPNTPVIPPNMNVTQPKHHAHTHHVFASKIDHQLSQIQKYNEHMKNINSNHRIVPPGINKFSPEYARIIGAKPRATASANVRLGGVY
jgi:hypothetical protein